jgi:hypothetical protein
MNEGSQIPKNFEIDQALREFEAKKQETEVVKAAKEAPKEGSSFTRMVIKYSGGSITQRQAEYLLLGFVAVAAVLSIFLFFKAFRSPSPPPSSEFFEAGPGKGF